MALKKDSLLNELEFTRDEIIAHTYHEKGFIPDVCNDQALKDMAKRKPIKPSDFKAIQGLDDTFIELYANRFLDVLAKYKSQAIHEVNVSRNAKKTLNEYQDRLTNLSRRNRNLYTPRTSQRNTVDLYQNHLIAKIISFLSNSKKRTLKLTNFIDNKNQDLFHRSLVILHREMQNMKKEKGSYNLFIAYPFVQGELPKDDFFIKAPLLFFPVTLERKAYDFYLHKDTEKDVLFNRDLILANHKINKFTKIDDTPNIDTFSISEFNKNVLEYYQRHHILIENGINPQDPLMPFENITLDQMPKKTSKKLTLLPNILLGKYSMYTSHIQEDIHTIIERKSYNDLIETLIDRPFNLYNYRADLPFKQTKYHSFVEEQLNYINDVNYAQEKVLSLIDNSDQLVIWGPPGTGKSQTITNIIAHQIANKDNVLVVSEKKVALDVIQTRLKDAASFTLFIDDAQNKADFYTQIRQLMHPQPPSRSQNNDRYTIDRKIDEKVVTLENIHKTFYSPNDKNIKLYTIYHRYLKDNKIIKNLLPEDVYNAVESRFSHLNIESLIDLEKRFDDKRLFKSILLYTSLLEDYPIFKKINTQLTRTQKQKRNQFLDDIEKTLIQYKDTFFFRKPTLRRKILQRYTPQVDYLYAKKRIAKKFIKELIHNHEMVELLRKHHSHFERYEKYLQELSADESRYIQMIKEDYPFKDTGDIEKYHTYIFDAYYTGYIERFEALNQDHVEALNQYHINLDNLKKLVMTKQAMNVDNFKMDLYQEALNLSNTKRNMDIKRHLESKRKKSVRDFIEHYQLELFAHVKVWLMTPEVVSEILPLNYAMFDLVVFDEASQLYVEKAIPTIYRAKKVVIAGDTKQLRPSSLGSGRYDSSEELEKDTVPIAKDAESLLDLARYQYPETILNYHYRSSFEELIAFSNFAFYEGKLRVSPNVNVERKPPIEYHVVEDGIWENRRNLKEAEKVIEIIKRVLRTRKHHESIGVITFNTQQRTQIEDLLDEEIYQNTRYSNKLQKEMNRKDKDEDQSLFVKNIENVQGDERDIIIFSTAYAKNQQGRFLRQFGWLNNEGGQNRLNVAISRAKRKIHFVTSFYPGNFKVDDLKGEGPKLLKRYMEYAYAISEKDHKQAEKVLALLYEKEIRKDHLEKSHLINSVEKRLNLLDYTIEKNIGIGGYSLDFVLVDKKTRSRLLGIICADQNPQNDDVRDQYYHQEKYLNARGWGIYRIFGPNWFKDPNKEMRQIRKYLNH